MRLKYDLDPLLNILGPTRVTQKENCTLKLQFSFFTRSKAFKEPLDISNALSPSCVMHHCQFIFIPRHSLLLARARSEMQQVFVVIRPAGATKMFVTALMLATSQAHTSQLYDENNRNANCNTANIRAIVTHPARHA